VVPRATPTNPGYVRDQPAINYAIAHKTAFIEATQKMRATRDDDFYIIQDADGVDHMAYAEDDDIPELVQCVKEQKS